jgi:hypothetical protein
MNALLSAIFAVLVLALSPDGGAPAGPVTRWTGDTGRAAALVAPPTEIDDDDNALGDPDRDDPTAESHLDARPAAARLAGLLPTCDGTAPRPRLVARSDSERGPPLTI